MRASEKTLELNFCAQFSELVRPRRTLWYGPTQRQEAQWGFDARSRLGGLCLIFQFKVLKWRHEGVWRLRAPHRQLCMLQQFAQDHDSEIDMMFYAFPLISGEDEHEQHPQLLPKTWLLDVYRLPSMPCPPRKDQTLPVEVRLEETMPAKAYLATIGQDFPLRCAEDLVHELREGRLGRHSDAADPKAQSTQPQGTGVQLRLPLPLGVILW
jgi:hypothetical protein